MLEQTDLFGTPPRLPEGFKYERDVISAAEEAGLIERFTDLPFKEFEFHGYLGKRRVVSFGWRYDYTARRIERSNDMPDFLLETRESAAAFAGMQSEDLQQALVTEY